MPVELPFGLHFVERGWLSSNSIFLDDGATTVLIDTGYYTHAPLLLSFLSSQLNNRPLDLLVNTHLHSDHCGGNHAVESAFPNAEIHIPYGLFDAVAIWDADKLSFHATGQSCPRFTPHTRLFPGDLTRWAGFEWEIHAAPGHDHDSLLFFNPHHRILISADALWANGFGIVFPEIMGGTGFEEVSQTLDLIKRLNPLMVLPGHGSVITNASHALDVAYQRLNYFSQSPVMHASHAAKVLLKFKLLELQYSLKSAFLQWAMSTPLIADIHSVFFYTMPIENWLDSLLQELIVKNAAFMQAETIHNK